MMQLRPYQNAAKAAILDQWTKGVRSTLLVLPTFAAKAVRHRKDEGVED